MGGDLFRMKLQKKKYTASLQIPHILTLHPFCDFKAAAAPPLPEKPITAQKVAAKKPATTKVVEADVGAGLGSHRW